jgi:exodeoxyribonuclease-5
VGFKEKIMDLTKEQTVALYHLHDGIEQNTLQQTLGGYAGTGKTTLVRYLKKMHPNFAVCAFTGKAANVLRRRGIHATTIHSLIYTPDKKDDGTVEFILKPNLECDGIIVDEASMVSEDLYFDLAAFNIPIVWIGDHGQLEPVGTDFNLMKKPMYKLETIHRNAGEIAQFAQHLRQGRPAAAFNGDGSQIEFGTYWDVTPKQYAEADQVICAFNKVRVRTNEKIREYLGYTNILEIGEKVMCLQNNSDLNIFNGMQGHVSDLSQTQNRHFLDLVTDDDEWSQIRYDRFQFGQERSTTEWYENMPNPFDYAYCITCHKAQGDEWGYVMVIENRCSHWEHRRWAYTAASRAKSRLYWILES